MQPITSFIPHLSSKKKFVITTHVNPDADALGSSLGLWHFLTSSGHEATVITPNDYPDFLNWMPGQEHVINAEKTDHEQLEKLTSEADYIFCLDFSALNRLKKFERFVVSAQKPIILVDHHQDPDDFASFALWDTKAAATAELIYDLIKLANSDYPISKEAASCLYAGLMTDTGSFRHPSTTAKVHRIVAELIDCGINVNQVSRSIYDNNTENRMRFLGYALLEKLIVKKDQGVAYFVITANDHDRFHLKSGDTEGLVNYALSIMGIFMAAIIIERNGEVKLSFRSVSNYAVNTFAAEYFEGGGHKNAAGGSSKKSLKETVERFENLIENFKNKYKLDSL